MLVTHKKTSQCVINTVKNCLLSKMTEYIYSYDIDQHLIDAFEENNFTRAKHIIDICVDNFPIEEHTYDSITLIQLNNVWLWYGINNKFFKDLFYYYMLLAKSKIRSQN